MVRYGYFLFSIPKIDYAIELFLIPVDFLFENRNDFGLNKLMKIFFLSLKFPLMSNNDFDKFDLI